MPDQPIQKCGDLFAFRCPMQWDALRETPEAGVRACDRCRKPVYLCESETEVFHHTMRGDCIAVPARMHPTRPVEPVPEKPEPRNLEPVDVLAARHGVPVAHLRDFALDPELLKLLPYDVANKHHMVPLFRDGPTLVVAMHDPSSVRAIDDVRFLTGYEVEVQVASWRDIQEVLKRWPPVEDNRLDLGLPDVIYLFTPSTPVERLLHYLLTHAHREAVEQLRIEVTDSSLVVRHLVEGTLREVLRPPLALGEKLLRHLEPSEASTEQPERFEYCTSDFRADCEVHLHPLERGMEVVLTLTGAEFH